MDKLFPLDHQEGLLEFAIFSLSQVDICEYKWQCVEWPDALLKIHVEGLRNDGLVIGQASWKPQKSTIRNMI